MLNHLTSDELAQVVNLDQAIRLCKSSLNEAQKARRAILARGRMRRLAAEKEAKA